MVPTRVESDAMDHRGCTRRDLLAGMMCLPWGRWMVGDRLRDLNEAARREGWFSLGPGERAVRVALFLRSTPYVAGTLDRSPGREVCELILDGFDCVTLVETCFAFARVLKAASGVSAEAVADEIQAFRYRGGRMGGFESRLHYACDWLADNALRGRIALPLKEEPLRQKWSKRLDFMSTHPRAYPALLGRPDRIEKIAEVERRVSSQNLDWVASANVQRVEPLLESGDMVALTTDVPGLDCSHTGLIYRDGPRARLLHASSAQNKVFLDVPLTQYVQRSNRITGVFVGRLEG